MIKKIIVVYCCLFVMDMLKSLCNKLFQKIGEYGKIDMISHRQYKMLQLLDKHQRERVRNSDYKKLDNIIIGKDFYDNVKYKDFEINVIMKELHECGYIYDVASVEPKFTDVHTCKITDKGYDMLKNRYVLFWYNQIDRIISIFSLISRIFVKFIGIYIMLLILENMV